MWVKMGTIVHLTAVLGGYREAIAAALVADLGQTHRAIKTATRWTGASERTVKYWMSAERGPSGEHLIALARHSDAVFITLLVMAGRIERESDSLDPDDRRR